MDEGVLEPFGGEVALLLGDPFLQPSVRHDLERHRFLPGQRSSRSWHRQARRVGARGTEGMWRMTELAEPAGGLPATGVPPHELPASLREAGLTNWIREPLAGAVDQRRRIIMPPAAAVMGTPAAAYQGALLAEARHQDTVFMMGDNPALPKMPARPALKDFFQLRFSKIARTHLLQSARVAKENGLDEKVIMAC